VQLILVTHNILEADGNTSEGELDPADSMNVVSMEKIAGSELMELLA